MKIVPKLIRPNRATRVGIVVSYLSEEVFIETPPSRDCEHWTYRMQQYVLSEEPAWPSTLDLIAMHVEKHVAELSAHRRMELLWELRGVIA